MALDHAFVANQDVTVAEGTALGESKRQLVYDVFKQRPTAANREWGLDSYVAALSTKRAPPATSLEGSPATSLAGSPAASESGGYVHVYTKYNGGTLIGGQATLTVFAPFVQGGPGAPTGGGGTAPG